MLEYYPQIKLVHVTTAVASGSLLLLRGLLVQLGRRAWALAVPLRYLSYMIDTTLLTAALMLASILPLASFSNGWLLTKLLLLPVYVCLGWLALRRDGLPGAGAAFLSGAMLVFTLMLAIARTHDPFGGLAAWFGAS
ncbi:MAG: SirB2 family protein [Steroidobacteraceae bacterium]